MEVGIFDVYRNSEHNINVFR